MDHDGRSLGQPSRPGRLPPTKARQPTSPGGVGIEATASGQLIDLTQRHLHFRQIRQAGQALVGRVDPAGDTRWRPGSANRSTPFTEKLGEPRKLIRVASAASATTSVLMSICSRLDSSSPRRSNAHAGASFGQPATTSIFTSMTLRLTNSGPGKDFWA